MSTGIEWPAVTEGGDEDETVWLDPLSSGAIVHRRSDGVDGVMMLTVCGLRFARFYSGQTPVFYDYGRPTAVAAGFAPCVGCFPEVAS